MKSLLACLCLLSLCAAQSPKVTYAKTEVAGKVKEAREVVAAMEVAVAVADAKALQAQISDLHKAMFRAETVLKAIAVKNLREGDRIAEAAFRLHDALTSFILLTLRIEDPKGDVGRAILPVYEKTVALKGYFEGYALVLAKLCRGWSDAVPAVKTAKGKTLKYADYSEEVLRKMAAAKKPPGK